MRHRNPFLASLRSFLKGVASLLDFGNTLPTLDVSAGDNGITQPDADAIRADWDAVGDDLRQVIWGIDWSK